MSVLCQLCGYICILLFHLQICWAIYTQDIVLFVSDYQLAKAICSQIKQYNSYILQQRPVPQSCSNSHLVAIFENQMDCIFRILACMIIKAIKISVRIFIPNTTNVQLNLEHFYCSIYSFVLLQLAS
jgi:hypothetical protein